MPTITRPLTGSIEDGYFQISEINSDDVRLSINASQTVFLHYNNVAIPKNAIISEAKLLSIRPTFTSGSLETIISGEANDNASTPTTLEVNYRSRTTATSEWLLSSSSTESSSFANVIQEIVNRPGWSSGNSLLIFVGTNVTGVSAGFFGYESAGASSAPQLTVTYTEPSGGALSGSGSLSFASGVSFSSNNISLSGSGSLITSTSSNQASAATENFDSFPADVLTAGGLGVPTASVYITGSDLRSDGNGEWWYFAQNGRFEVSGDFDITYELTINPGGSTTRDIANFGFWITNAGATADGYMLRTQTAADDGGFFEVADGAHNLAVVGQTWTGTLAGSGMAHDPNAKLNRVPSNTKLRIQLVASGSIVNATITRVSDSVILATGSVNLSSGVAPKSGTFGQKQDGAGSTVGHRWHSVALEGTSEASGSLTLSGSGQLTLIQQVDISGSLNLSGSGSLTAETLVDTYDTLTLSGSGSLALSGSAVEAASGTLALAGSGLLTATGTATQQASGALALSGSGSLTVQSQVATSGSLNLSGSGSLTLQPQAITSGSLNLAGSGSLTLFGAATEQASGALSLSGSGSLTLQPQITTTGSLDLSGSGQLVASGSSEETTSGSLNLSGSGSLITAGRLVASSTISLTGAGTLAYAATVAQRATVVLTGSGLLTSTSTITSRGQVNLTGSGILTTIIRPATTGTASLSGLGTLSIQAATEVTAQLALTGGSLLELTGYGIQEQYFTGWGIPIM